MRVRRPFIGRMLAALAVTAVVPAAFAATSLPPLPDEIKSAGRLKVGVRCDQPPYGFQDEKGGYAGVETDMARQIAKWAFNDETKVAFTCVTAENRIPQLNAKRVDLLIATLGITPDRARVIDFSKPYRWGASGIVVQNDSPYQKVKDLAGKTVITPKGSVQATWFEQNMPDVQTLRLNSSAESLQAFKQKRGDAYAHDGATLAVLANNDKSLRMLDDPYQFSDAAMGVRKNEAAWQAYVSAAIDRMREEKLFAAWIDKWIPEGIRPYYVNMFQNPRPDGK